MLRYVMTSHQKTVVDGYIKKCLEVHRDDTCPLNTLVNVNGVLMHPITGPLFLELKKQLEQKNQILKVRS